MATEEERKRMAKVLGSAGGKARRDKLSPGKRKRIARKAAQARWNPQVSDH